MRIEALVSSVGKSFGLLVAALPLKDELILSRAKKERETTIAVSRSHIGETPIRT
jgi:hypothetical protein